MDQLSRVRPACNASSECWELYGEVAGVEAGVEAGAVALQRHHQLTVDAYLAQHPGRQGR